MDAGSPAGASGPGPPDRRGRGGKDELENSGERWEASRASSRADRGGGGGQGKKGAGGGLGGGMATARQGGRDGGVKELLVPPPKARLDRVKAEAKEVRGERRVRTDNDTINTTELSLIQQKYVYFFVCCMLAGAGRAGVAT